MPPGLSAEELKLAAGLVRPEWVGEESLRHLEEMSLPEDIVLRVLEMLIDGLIRAPEREPASGAVAAALALMRPRLPQTAEDLARQVTLLYEQNERALRLRPQAWLSHLNDLAEAKLEPTPRALIEVLRAHCATQWLIIDCLGLPILRTLEEILPSCFPHWKTHSVEYALSSPESTTDAFYRTLIDGGIAYSFEKINAVDERLHAKKESLPDLARVARAELEIAFRRLIPKLDAGKPVLIFGDHGFRLALDGRGFTHGGRSTLERLVPIVHLLPI